MEKMTTDTNSILKDIEINTNLSRFKIEEIRVLMVQQNYLLSLHNEQLIKALNENNLLLEDLSIKNNDLLINLMEQIKDLLFEIKDK